MKSTIPEYNRIHTLAAIFVIVTSTALTQNTRLRWSTMDVAFAISSGPGMQVKSTTGEPFSGFAVGPNVAVGSGFLADSVVRSRVTDVQSTTTQPTVYALRQNYPNPFNPSTTIAYDLPNRSSVHLAIFNILGQLVVDLIHEERGPGRYTVVWNGRTNGGAQASSGVYFYRIQALSSDGRTSFVDTKRLVLLK